MKRIERPTSATGLWPQPHKDATNLRRCELPGAMTQAPSEIWRYGNQRRQPTWAAPITWHGESAYLLLVNRRLILVRRDGSTPWRETLPGVAEVVGVIQADPAPGILVVQGDTYCRLSLLDSETGRTVWNHEVTDVDYRFSSYKFEDLGGGRARLFLFPVGSTLGMRFDFKSATAPPEIRWQHDYHDQFLPDYGPALILADMDNDGRQELVLASKPACVLVIDPDTGSVLFDCHYRIDGDSIGQAGRPYGLIQAVDLDGHRFPDVVVASGNVEEYLAVLHNENGRGLRLAWSQFIEKDFPNDFRELRVSLTSVADVNGDNCQELVFSLYNMTGDNRWHTLILDSRRGFQAPLADWSDRAFLGCYDIDGNGRPEIITIASPDRRLPQSGRIECFDGQSGQCLATLEGASLEMSWIENNAQLPPATAFLMQTGRPLAVPWPDGRERLVLRLRDKPESEMTFWLQEGTPRTEPFQVSNLSRLLLFSGTYRSSSNLSADIPYPLSNKGPAVYGPLVAQVGHRRELIVSRDDGTIAGGTPDFQRSGHLLSSWTVPGVMPSVWIGPHGRRVLCCIDPREDRLMLLEPGARRPAGLSQTVVDLPHPPMRHANSAGESERRTKAKAQTSLTVFDSAGEFRVLVPLRTGAHTGACALYDRDGVRLWLDERNGPFPNSAAAADLNGDGQAEVLVDDKGVEFIYGADGARRLIAHAWGNVPPGHQEIPGRSEGTAHAFPIILPGRDAEATQIIMAPGFSAIETLDRSGNLLQRRIFPYWLYFYMATPAVARPQPNDAWTLGLIREGVFHCIDIESLESRWTIALGERLLAWTPIVAGDVDGDGRDEFLLGTATGMLYALREDPATGKGAILWQTRLDAGITDLIMADVNGDGQAEIVLSTDDGFVRVLQ